MTPARPDPDRTDGGVLPYEPPAVRELEILDVVEALGGARDLIRRLVNEPRQRLEAFDARLAHDARAWFARWGRP